MYLVFRCRKISTSARSGVPPFPGNQFSSEDQNAFAFSSFFDAFPQSQVLMTALEKLHKATASPD